MRLDKTQGAKCGIAVIRERARQSRIAHHKGVETKVSTPLFFNKLPYKELLYISSTASFVASVGAIPNKPLKDGVVNAR